VIQETDHPSATRGSVILDAHVFVHVNHPVTFVDPAHNITAHSTLPRNFQDQDMRNILSEDQLLEMVRQAIDLPVWNVNRAGANTEGEV
jgi:hypothetical protein